MTRYLRRLLGALTIVTAGCGVLHRSPAAPKNIPVVKGDPRALFALRVIDVKVGTGAKVAARQCIYTHYTGWLVDGTKFDSSRDTMPNGQPKAPLTFNQGVRRVIAGWDLGFEGMQVGGQRRLFIPYQLAYGEAGRPPVIPPKSDLIFDVELMATADTLRTADIPVRADSTRRTVPAGPQCPAWATLNAGR